MIATGGSIPTTAKLKRRLDTPIQGNDSKRRMLDNLSNLSLDSPQFGQVTTKSSSSSPKLFGVDLFMSPHNSLDLQKSKADDPIIISSIDDFLRRNPDNDDIVGKSIVNYNNVDMNKIVIANLNNLSDIYICDPGNKRQTFSYERIFARKLKEKDANDHSPVEVTNSEIHYDQYLQQNWSLIRWRDPNEVIMEHLEKWWCAENEKESYQDDVMMDDEFGSFEQSESFRSPQEIDYNMWTSHYGSYYEPTNAIVDDSGSGNEMDID